MDSTDSEDSDNKFNLQSTSNFNLSKNNHGQSTGGEDETEDSKLDEIDQPTGVPPKLSVNNSKFDGEKGNSIDHGNNQSVGWKGKSPQPDKNDQPTGGEGECPKVDKNDQGTGIEGETPKTNEKNQPTGGEGEPTKQGKNDQPTDGEGEPTKQGKNDQPSDGEGEPTKQGKNDQPTDGKGEPTKQGKNDQPTDGKGEPTKQGKNDQPTDGKGEPTKQGKNDQPTDGEGEPTKQSKNDQPTDGEDEPTKQGKNDQPTDGEGEPTEQGKNDQSSDGEGEPTKQGKNDQPTDGEGEINKPDKDDQPIDEGVPLKRGKRDQTTDSEEKKDQSTDIEIENDVPLKKPDFTIRVRLDLYEHSFEIEAMNITELKPQTRQDFIKILFSSQTTKHHFLCFKLKDGFPDSNDLTHAYIAINDQDNYMFSDQCNADIPVFLITLEDGKQLLSRDDFSCIVFPTSISGKVIPEPDGSQQKDESQQKGYGITEKIGRGIKWIVRGGSHGDTLSSQLHFVKKQTEGISFSLKAFKGDIEMLTTAVYQDSELKSLLQSFIRSYLRSKMTQDFPFFLVLSYVLWQYIKESKPGATSEINKFVNECQDCFDNIQPAQICSVLTKFYECKHFTMETLTVTEILETDVFSLLHKALLWHVNFRKGRLPLKKEKGHLKILFSWIAVSLKSSSYSSKVNMHDLHQLWSHLPFKGLNISGSVVEVILDGMKLCEQLDLEDLSFTMTEFNNLVLSNKLRTFYEMQSITLTLHNANKIQEESHFNSFMSEMRIVHEAEMDKNRGQYIHLSSTNNRRVEVINEGLIFIDSMWLVMTERSWETSQNMRDELQLWVEFFLKFVDILNDNFEIYLKPFLSCSIVFLRELAELHFQQMLEENLLQMKITQITHLYTFTDIFSSELLAKYIKEYIEQVKSSQISVKFSDDFWKPLLSEVVKRFPGPSNHDFVCLLLLEVKNKYFQRRAVHQYVLDLIKLDVKGLMEIQDAIDETILTKFTDSLQESLFTSNFGRHFQMKTFLDHLSQKNSLTTVDSILLKMLPPIILQPRNVRGESIDTIHLVNERLNEQIKSAFFNPNEIQVFSWTILGNVCQKMNTIPQEIIPMGCKWFCDNATVLESIAEPYQVYFATVSSEQSECTNELIDFVSNTDIIVEDIEIPFEITPHARDYLKLLRNTFQLLLKAYNKVATDVLNIEELKFLQSSAKKLTSIATSLCMSTCITEELILEKLERFDTIYRELKKCLLFCKPTGECIGLLSLFRDYNVAMEPQLLEELQKCVAFPDDRASDDFIICEVNGLKLSKYLSLKSAEVFKDNLCRGLAVVEKEMPFFAYFHTQQSSLFSQFMEKHLCAESNRTHSIEEFGDALRLTQATFKEILEGTAHFSDITEIANITLAHISNEFDLLKHFFKYDSNSLKHFEDMITLKSLLPTITHTETVCQTFHLDACLEDQNFQRLQNLSKELDDDKISTLELQEASQFLQKAIRWFGVDNSQKDWKFPQVLEVLSKSNVLYDFLADNNFLGERGQILFQQQFSLVNQQLQGEEYQQEILSHLSVAYKFIISLNVESFQAFIRKCDLSQNVAELNNVNHKVDSLRLWFSRIEEDSVKNISADLTSICATGVFKIVATTTGSERIILQFQSEAHKKSLEWDIDRIQDFVRKLGFLELDEKEKQTELFLFYYETADRLQNETKCLYKLGHPIYSMPGHIDEIECFQQKEIASEKLHKVHDEVEKWIEQAEKLLDEYHWLVLLNNTKLMKMYKLLKSNEDSSILSSEVKKELGILFVNEMDNENTLTVNIKASLQEFARLKPTLENAFADKWTGTFLQIFYEKNCNKSPIPHYIIPKSNRRYAFFHKTLDDTPKMMLTLILTIFKSIPVCFQIFLCHPTMQEPDIKRFFQCISKFPGQYVFIEVNKLTSHLQEVLIRSYLELQSQWSDDKNCSEIHFIESAVSIVEEAPWIIQYPHRMLTNDEIQTICKEKVVNSGDFETIEIVHGLSGNGKTHYIKNQMKMSSHAAVIAVHEKFSVAKTISTLNSLPEDRCSIHFNFTLIPPGESVDKNEKVEFENLMRHIGWFLFNLLALGYVEDSNSEESFRMPKKCSWKLYIEIPSPSNYEDSEQWLRTFLTFVPICEFAGTKKLIDENYPYEVDEDVQLVCKYLLAYDTGEIDKLYNERDIDGIKYGKGPDLQPQKCHEILNKYMASHVKRSKLNQKLYIGYMKRRCEVLENFPGFNFNVTIEKFGSTLMKAMIGEVTVFSDPRNKGKWQSEHTHQLIYDFQDRGASIDLISSHPESIAPPLKKEFEKIGIQIKHAEEMYERGVLDVYLARALSIPEHTLVEKELSHYGEEKKLCKTLSLIDDHNYVLTLDYTLKMLNINERYECGIPVIIEGETGVGKTALLEMLSKLWNHSWTVQWKNKKTDLLHLIKTCLSITESDQYDEGDIIETINQKFEQDVDINSMKELTEKLKQLMSDPVFAVLHPSDRSITQEQLWSKLEESLENTHDKKLVKDTILLIITAKISTFHKLDVHAGLTPKDVIEFFSVVNFQAAKMKECYNLCHERLIHRIPRVIAYLDEINTSSCLGLFKEIVVDGTFEGNPLPTNVFIVAACNPQRDASLSMLSDNWHKPTYYVRALHPTLEFLKWDYGSLDSTQESEYVNVKMRMVSTDIHGVDVIGLSYLITESQNKIRSFSKKALKRNPDITDGAAETYSKSSVSQRDMQRVFDFYKWLMATYRDLNRHNKSEHPQRAVLVALGLVYYMRLDKTFRKEYADFIDKESSRIGQIKFKEAFNDDLKWFVDNIHIPPGIAKTRALMENVFANIICSETRTPLIILGEPGTSKTLSFNLTVENLKGKESKKEVFKMPTFHSLEPFFYQCSRHTTSAEVENVFKTAIERQDTYNKAKLHVRSVVFMDEAGLPEERHESLKVLHYFLDRRYVSFVAISNHALDAAKSNRALCLFRPKTSKEDLQVLAISSADMNLNQSEEQMVLGFCSVFSEIMENAEFKKFYGQRDFIHFVNFLRRWCGSSGLSAQLVFKGLERNFNGHEKFEKISQMFLSEVPNSSSLKKQRNILHVLQDSLEDKPEVTQQGNVENGVRYKLIIDSSNDKSAARLLFAHGVLRKENTRMYVCSDFLDESQMHINTISSIRHSASQGHTIIMCQTDEIHECFYELFNQRFRVIEDPKTRELKMFTNISIGAHTKASRVDKNFQCIVVISKSDLKNTPAPFLNRFEKYFLSYDSVYQATCMGLPPNLKKIVCTACSKVEVLIEEIGLSDSLYSYSARTEKNDNTTVFIHETLYSIVLSLLPPVDHTYKKADVKVADVEEKELQILLTLLNALRDQGGFHIPQELLTVLKTDSCDDIFKFVHALPTLKNILSQDTNIAGAVGEALDTLYHPTGQLTDIYEDTGLVITVFMQWLVQFLVKKVIQLLTPEGLVINHLKIPQNFVYSYLKSQEHFSLKEVIQNQLKKLEENNWDSLLCPTKLLCYTRSSPLTTQLPTTFPSDHIDSSSAVENLVYPDANKVMLFKLTRTLSERELQRRIKSFVDNQSQQILVFLATMHQAEITGEMINHLRILVEQKEFQNPSQQKLFVALLLFPHESFYSSCYQSFFLTGWDHIYLDCIACGSVVNLETIHNFLDLKKCFQCCLKIEDSESMPFQLQNALKDSLPAIASRIQEGCNGGSFNVQMVFSKRKAILDELFNMPVGEALCESFHQFWSAKVMKQYLEDAAHFTVTHQSTLSMTSYVHTRVKALFIDFVIYMLSQLNKDCNLDILFKHQENEVVKSLYAEMTKTYSKVKLQDLHVLSKSTPVPESRNYSFPFFGIMLKTMEELMDEVQEESNKIMNINTGTRQSKEEKEEIMNNLIVEKLIEAKKVRLEKSSTKRQQIIGALVYSLERSEELKELFYSDFAKHKFHLTSESMEHNEHVQLSHSLQETFSHSEIEPWLAQLHVYSKSHQLDLAKFTKIMRNITTFVMLHNSTAAGQSLQQMSMIVHEQKAPSHSASHIINVADEALNLLLSSENVDTTKLQEWYKAYFQIVNIQSITDDIHETCDSPKSKYNKTLAIYLMIHIHGEVTEEVASLVKTAYNSLSMNEVCFLRHIAEECYKQLRPAPATKISYFFEILFSHYFASDITPNKDDCIWFFEKGLGIANKHENNQGNNQTVLPLLEYISPHYYGFYLSWILGSNKDEYGDIFGLFKSETRKYLGEVLNSSSVAGSVSLMTIVGNDTLPWLQVLYVKTVLERLELSDYKPLTATRTMIALNEQVGGGDDSEKLLKSIDRLVFLQYLLKLVINAWFKKTIQGRVIKDLDELILKETPETQDEASLFLCVHLWKCLNSVEQFSEVLVNEQDLLSNFHCLDGFRQNIQTSRSPERNLAFVLINPTLDTTIAKFYKDMIDLLQKIHSGEQSSDKLVDLAKESHNSSDKIEVDFKLPSGTFFIPKSNAFCMCLWLACYFEFYNKKIISELLGEKVRLLKDYLPMGVSRILRCFFNIRLATSIPECQVVGESDYNMHEVPGTEEDPIYDFFFSDDTVRPDWTIQQKRNAMANMIAAVIACPEKKCHLWYHVFSPKDMSEKQITGFMYDFNNLWHSYHYDCGLEFNHDGTYGRQDYDTRTSKGIIGIQGLYFLIWANMSAFCFCLLTQKNATQMLKGPVLSDWQAVRHYCLGQMNAMWWHLECSLDQPIEETSLMVVRAMQRLTMNCYQRDQICLFDTVNDRDRYEERWDKEIFLPSCDDVKNKFAEYAKASQRESEIINRVRELHKVYPIFPNMDTFTRYFLQGSRDFKVLQKFFNEYSRLKASGELLPLLIQFYKWIHMDMLFICTRAEADRVTIQQIVIKASKRYSETLESHYMSLFEELLEKYNKYVETVNNAIGFGGCGQVRRENTLPKITQDANFTYFLSEKETTEEGNDCLFLVISDIVSYHNQLLLSICDIVHDDESYLHLRKYLLPSVSLSSIQIDEVDESVMILNRDFEPIIKKWFEGGNTFNLSRIEEDVVAVYFAERSQIVGEKTLRRLYKFKDEPKPDDGLDGVLDISVLEDIDSAFKEDFPDNDDNVKVLELEFLSADYECLQNVAGGLLAICRNLDKVTGENKELASDLASKMLPEVIRKTHFSEEEQTIEVTSITLFEHVGIELKPSQCRCLENIPAKHLAKLINYLVQWIKDGIYDFQALPVAMKKHMLKEDETKFLSIIEKYRGSLQQLKEQLDGFKQLLKDAEENIKLNIDGVSQISIVAQLREYGLLDEEDEKIVEFINPSVLIENYVSFRIVLRRINSEVERKINSNDKIARGQAPNTRQWSAFVDDLWTAEDKLLHLGEITSGKVHKLEEKYGLEERDPSDDDSDLEDESGRVVCPGSRQAASTTAHETLPDKNWQTEARVLTPSDILDYLRSINLEKYASNFEDIDGDMMLHVVTEKDEDLLKDLEVNNKVHRVKIMSKFKTFVEERMKTVEGLEAS